MARPRWKIIRRILGGLAIGLVGGALAGVACVRTQLPDAHLPPLAGLSARVSVGMDVRAIPTVHGQSLLDVTRAQGYLTARERLFQMELQRRLASGTLAELFGAGALPADRMHRTYGFRTIADEAVGLLSDKDRAFLDAYASGVNAFIDSHPGHWGFEFQLLKLAPAHWTVADSLLVVLLLHEQLACDWKMELVVESLNALPLDERRFFMPRATSDDLLLVPDREAAPDDAEGFFKTTHSSFSPAELPPDRLGLPPNAGLRERAIGSNTWVIGGGRTASHQPILANDPHLGLTEPGTWYAIRLAWPDHLVEGVSIAGFPGVVLGKNERISWGAANLMTDVQDLYREPGDHERIETIPVKGAAAESFHVPLGRHGPQVRPGYSLRWPALDPHHAGLPLATLMEAHDWPTFNAALDAYAGPALSIVYADADGHIGWRPVGLVPIRADDDDGSAPRDGAGDTHEWRGFVPQTELPRVFDPPNGYIVAANQRVVGSSYPHVFATSWGPPHRAKRIAELIEQKNEIDRAAIEGMQLDVVSIFHRDMMRALATRTAGLERFRSWDGAAHAEDDLFLVAFAWGNALRDTLKKRLLNGPNTADFMWWNDDATILAILHEDDAAWTRAGLGDKTAFLDETKKTVVAWLDAQPSKSWGAFDALDTKHPFGRAGRVPGWLFNPPGFPQSGARGTPRVTEPMFGQSMRFIIDWGDPSAATLVLPLGQSGHLLSANRTDQQALWRDGDPTGAQTRLAAPPSGSPLVFEP